MTDNKLKFARGSIFLVGNEINFIATKWKSLLKDSVPKTFFDNREKRDGEQFHMTVIGKRQLCDLKSKEISVEDILTAVRDVNLNSFVDVGLGKARDEEGNCSWFVIVSFEGIRSALRPFLNDSKPVNFHITLAFNPVDVHSTSKDLNSLIDGPLNQNLLPGKWFTTEIRSLIRGSHYAEALKIVNCTQMTAEILEIKAFLLFKLGHFEECIEISCEIQKLPELSTKFNVLAFI